MRSFMRVLALLLVFVWIAQTPLLTVHALPDRQDDVQAMVDAITADGVGTVVEVHDNGSGVPIIIFQEIHTSVVGQVEIAIMLNRLYRDYGSTEIGLEAAFSDLDGSWYHALPSTPERQAEVVSRLIAEGEINSAELMTLVHTDVKVHGIEDEFQYAQAEETSTGSGSIIFLLYFALSQMTAEQQAESDDVYEKDGLDAYLDFIFQFDEWSGERFENLTGCDNSSAEHIIDVVDEIAARAEREGYYDAPDFDEFHLGMELEREFYVLASERSETMVQKTIAIAENVSAPLPIIIGSAHTELMVELFAAEGYSVAVIQSASYPATCDNTDAAVLSSFAYDRKSNQLSVDAAGGLGSFLDARTSIEQMKPMAVIDQDFFQRKATAYYAADVLSEVLAATPPPAARDLPTPYGIGDKLNDFDAAGFIINRNTLTLVPADPADPQGPPAFLFEVTFAQTPNSPALTLWMKVAHQAIDATLNEQLTSLRNETPDYLEVLLRAEHADLQTQAVTPATDVEADANPVIESSMDTLMTVANTEAQALGQSLTRQR